MSVARNIAPCATVEIAGKRTVENAVHAARYYRVQGDRRTVAEILAELMGDYARHGATVVVDDDAAAQRRDVLRAAWQYASGWAKDCARGQAARHLGRTGQIMDGDQWAARPTIHADVITCTGGHGAPHAMLPALRDVLGASRCTSDVCGPVFARIDAERAQ